MKEIFLSPYNPRETEDKIYKIWEESGFFNPDNLPERHKRPFSVVLPPPNATGTLHIGGAIMTVIEDIMVRYKRMQGFKTLWLPGTDHAAIATNAKMEKILNKEEGKSRHDIGRDAFIKKVEQFVDNNRGTLKHQISKMGTSLDWSREAFTFDDKRNFAVRSAFKKMYDEGLIYRGHRIVNWDPKGQTVISDDETIYEERKNKFYTFKYGPFEIGTARPETKFGDKYVVMHPKDKRYKNWKHGQKIIVEWINGPLEATVIKDEIIDMEFGTGVMTITPWHSHEDFALAEKYRLDKEQIIDQFGRLLPVAGDFAGMKINEAREKIVDKLKSKGLLVSVDENYMNRIATAERTGGIIEPQIMLQWFVDVNKKIPSRRNKSLKELMTEPVRDGKIKILPNHFEKVYFHWIENLRDWCVSRQIWYGHRIPAWYKNDKIYVGLEAPGDGGWIQDPDTLDTWFSSGLWTFSTLGWPEQTEDLKIFHPTDVLETGYDILFFWVARMILMSQFLLGEIPFRTVYLHGLVRNEKGEKISKSLGNNLDPLDVISTYGTDATRMALIVGVGPGADSKLGNDKLKAYKHFANKIWNIARFVLLNTENISGEKPGKISEQEQTLITAFEDLITDITTDMDNFRFYLAAEKLYHYVWHTFADKIVEESKEKLSGGYAEDIASTKYVLKYIFETSLVLLHPFMPFITEEIWSNIEDKKDKTLLMITEWPRL